MTVIDNRYKEVICFKCAQLSSKFKPYGWMFPTSKEKIIYFSGDLVAWKEKWVKISLAFN